MTNEAVAHSFAACMPPAVGYTSTSHGCAKTVPWPTATPNCSSTHAATPADAALTAAVLVIFTDLLQWEALEGFMGMGM